MKVELRVYDLSQGMARMLSQQLTGKLIEGIWHTSVVLYNKEVYYGQGIQIDAPGTTMHGHPIKVIDMGETAIPEEVFWEYIETLRDHWTAEIFREVCMFLVGKSIPDYIADLPKEFLSTPFGQQIAPMISSMFGPSRIAAEHQPDLDFTSILNANPNIASAVTSALGGAPPAISRTIPTPTLMQTQRSPILFSQCSQLDKIFAKLKEVLEAKSVGYDKGVVDGIRDGLVDKFEKKVAGGLKLPAGWEKEFVTILQNLPVDDLWPALDILRLMILDNSVNSYFIREKAATLPHLIHKLVSTTQTFTTLSKPTRLMLLRLACNLFSTDPSLAHYLSTTSIDATEPTLSATTHRSVMTALLVESLLCEEDTVRQVASSLAFNMAARTLVVRAVAGDDALLEEWESEILAVIVKAVETEKDHEILLRLLSALGLLLFERSEALVSLAQVLDTGAMLAGKVTVLKGLKPVASDEQARLTKILALVSEISALLK
ncbi:PUL domain-containing protein [Chytridium lagenaria]|nr:PUL domain-containing protein [Chytridium lagenaria]